MTFLWKILQKNSIALAGLIIAVLSLFIVYSHNQRILELENIKTDLQKEVIDLTLNQSILQQQIFELQNYEPTIEIQAIQPIVIGPTPPITVLADGRVSFEYNGALYLNLTVLVATAHSGKLTVIGNSLILDYNASQLQIGFSYSGITANDYGCLFAAGSAEIVSINMPFVIYYKFSESHILQYEDFEIARLYFKLQFYDFQTSSIKFSNTLQTGFIWNNQTSPL